MPLWRQPLDKFNLGPAFGVVDAEHPNGHRGCDYNGFPAGTPLLAVADATVALNQWSDALGHVIVLKVNRAPQLPFYFGYCHLESAPKLEVGAKVKIGQTVGHAGTTGSASTGVHLHLTLSLTKLGVFSGAVKDAYSFLKERVAAQNKKVAKKK